VLALGGYGFNNEGLRRVPNHGDSVAPPVVAGTPVTESLLQQTADLVNPRRSGEHRTTAEARIDLEYVPEESVRI